MSDRCTASYTEPQKGQKYECLILQESEYWWIVRVFKPPYPPQQSSEPLGATSLEDGKGVGRDMLLHEVKTDGGDPLLVPPLVWTQLD
jgi:hypothetical protein